jgi:hypothetical protein
MLMTKEEKTCNNTSNFHEYLTNIFVCLAGKELVICFDFCTAIITHTANEA